MRSRYEMRQALSSGFRFNGPGRSEFASVCVVGGTQRNRRYLSVSLSPDVSARSVTTRIVQTTEIASEWYPGFSQKLAPGHAIACPLPRCCDYQPHRRSDVTYENKSLNNVTVSKLTAILALFVRTILWLLRTYHPSTVRCLLTSCELSPITVEG